jgi:predicted CXXCH cytochrome family protein
MLGILRYIRRLRSAIFQEVSIVRMQLRGTFPMQCGDSMPYSCRFRRRWLAAGSLALLLALLVIAGASADTPGTDPTAQGDNTSCIGCHQNPGLATTLASGEVLPLTVDPHAYSASVHGSLTCVACHTNISGYPHPPLTAGDRRSFQLERYTQCKTCHPQQYQETLDSNHARALAGGDRQAAICTDCHGSHDITNPAEPRQKISTTCGKCHSTIYDQYVQSVHGQALTEGNPDVPVCTDCHGVHTQENPETVAFRLASPDLCGKCHADKALMEKYGISTDVFSTYVSDFHGKTVELFHHENSDQPVNEAVCTDCHGVHDIQQVSSENPTVVKENLLVACRRCHPDATANFPDSWVGHFIPSREYYPLVYYVNLFYSIFIPAVIGGMGLFVLLDAGRRILDHFRRANRHAGGKEA